MFKEKKLSNEEEFFKIGKKVLENQLLLSRFQKGMAIKKIIEKQDKKLMRKTLDQLKKKENPWLIKSIRMFATHSSIKSSTMVSLWRMKAFK